ncbi:MAG: hypothetical protein GY834_17180 [Bacteroidetes bacterium]|nr:hypothetical protein [Bacteroidota bacterium]
MQQLNNQNGSVLVAALVMIAVLLTLFLSAFSYGVARYSVHVKNQFQIQATYLAESGINRLVTMLNSQEIELESQVDDTLRIDIEDVGNYAVTLRPYGAYHLIESIGFSGSQKSTKYILLGTVLHEFTDNALTITDKRFPIVATGLTRITGDIYSPPVQLTTGQIEGRGIIDENFHTGKRIIVDSIASPYSTFSIIDKYSEYVYQYLKPEAKTVSTSIQVSGNDEFFNGKGLVAVQGNLELNDVILKRAKRPLTILVSGWVAIGGKSELQGLVEIVSEQFIKLSDSSVCVGGLLYAEDSITIEDDAYFSGQAISHSQLNISDSSHIAYPSLLLTNSSVFSDKVKFGIRISTDIPITADIMYVSTDTLKQKDNEVIEIDSNVTFTGVVYSSDYLNLYGNVSGSVITTNLKFVIPPTTYINWLKDVNINRSLLDYTPVLPISKQDSCYYSTIYLREKYE